MSIIDAYAHNGGLWMATIFVAISIGGWIAKAGKSAADD